MVKKIKAKVSQKKTSIFYSKIPKKSKIKPFIICKKCGKEASPHDRVKGLCRRCYIQTPKIKAWRKNYFRKKWLETKADPVKLKAWNKRCSKNTKVYMKRHPDAPRKYYLILRSNPKRWAARLKYVRERYRKNKLLK